MNNLYLIFPEIFISLSLMFLLMFGVFKKNSENIVYSFAILTFLFLLALIINLVNINKEYLFNQSYTIDKLSTFMKILIVGSAIFVMISSSLAKRRWHSADKTIVSSSTNNKFLRCNIGIYFF